MGLTPQHFHTIPTSCAILLPLTQYALCCVQRRVVEGSGVSSGAWEGSAFCCAWRVSYVEVCYNVVAILSMAVMAVCRNYIA